MAMNPRNYIQSRAHVCCLLGRRAIASGLSPRRPLTWEQLRGTDDSMQVPHVCVRMHVRAQDMRYRMPVLPTACLTPNRAWTSTDTWGPTSPAKPCSSAPGTHTTRSLLPISASLPWSSQVWRKAPGSCLQLHTKRWGWNQALEGHWPQLASPPAGFLSRHHYRRV